MTVTSDDAAVTRAHRRARQVPAPVRALWRWLAPAALLLAVVAVGLATWSLTRAPTAAILAGDPKVRVCNAFDTVSKAVSGQTHADLGPDPVAQEAVAGNARLSLVGGGQYLLSRLDPLTPQELADAIRSFADDLQDVGLNALAGRANTDPDQSARMAHADSTRKQIIDLCT
ncbi:hypothetical protein [Mycobacterium sp. RTGN5]|uniref:hypothetical protein n=1 Tax=Mycobacterium sp. RTGN5 TaxID=3016522 RepID=UPI0029C698E5|nr:hypothetical protein [Mycobacterium sp. RTGN5]